MGNAPILTDDLLKAAFDYRRTELWNELDDSDVFATMLSNGKVVYCAVLGNNARHYGLGLYIGEKGFSTYLRMVEADDLSLEEWQHLAMTFDYINTDFEDEEGEENFLDDDEKTLIRDYALRKGLIISPDHGWPDFSRLRPGKSPYGIKDPQEAKWMTEALKAAVEVANKVQSEGTEAAGFDHGGEYAGREGGKPIPLLTPLADGGYQWSQIRTPKYVPEAYPNPDYMDDGRLEQLDDIKKKSVWQCRVTYLSSAIESDLDGVPYFPLTLIAVDKTSGKVPMMPIMMEETITDDTVILDRFADMMIKTEQVPRTIEVSDRRTYLLLEDFCVQEDINLNMVSDTPVLDAVMFSLEHHMRN